MKLFLFVLLLIVFLTYSSGAFDGRKWHVSTGNLSVSFIRMSPIGAGVQPGYQMEPPPPVETLKEMKRQGLVAYEDYVAWGAVEREPGKWDWTQHDKVCDAIKAAGLDYVVYNWTHFPPVWLRESGKVTLMKCIEHGKTTNYVSIFDPRTIEYYDHFYKAMADHFGDRIDAVYACILGPYGEGNYPLNVPDYVNIGHCHEGYWCADPYALASFRDAVRKQYIDISAVNAAWGTTYKSFSDIRPPKAISESFKPSPGEFKTAAERRQWLDFITWYHQALIDFAEKSIQVTLKYFPAEKVRTKPGGNAGGVNPIAWGTYCPGYAKMAAPYKIALQPADCRGAVFGDRWIGTSYDFYGVRLSTEPAGGLDRNTFVRRMFSDASCGASEIFTYEFMAHVPEVQKYVHLLTGEMGETDIAVYCPTTLYRLGGDLGPTIRAAEELRDLTDFHVFDELLIHDGILNKNSNWRRLLIMFQGDYVEQAVLDRIEKWVKGGGTLIIASAEPVLNVDGEVWDLDSGKLEAGLGNVIRTTPENKTFLTESFISAVRPFIKADGKADGVWTTIRHGQVLLYNTTDKPVSCEFQVKGKSHNVHVAPHSIFNSDGP